MFYDIIEQFEIFKTCDCVEHISFYVIFNVVVLYGLTTLSYVFLTTNMWSSARVFAMTFFNLLKTNIKEKFKETHFSIVMSLFFFVLFVFIFWNNIIGMIPDVFTYTSYIVLPAYLSIVFFLASFFIVIYQTKFLFLKGFLPDGVPVPVQPFLFVIEFLSYFIRLFSLAIRLFINMLAGHLLLKIFSTIVLVLAANFNENFIVEIFINFIILAFIFLEYAACFLQAIVFVSLVAIYVDHALNFIH